MRQNGTFIVPVSVSINLESFFEYLTETLKNIVLDYLNEHADNASENSCDIDIEDYDIQINNLDIEGTYESKSFPATRTDPPEYDLTVTPDDDDFSQKELLQYIKNRVPNWLQPYISSVSITIHNNKRELQASEPDWDSMPGGYDDIRYDDV